jgi:hypothetical protein
MRGSSSNLLHVPGLQPSFTNLLQAPKASSLYGLASAWWQRSSCR